MAVIIQQAFPVVGGTRRPLITKMASDNLFLGEDLPAVGVISVTVGAAVDATFIFTFGSNILTFTAKATPDSSGTQFTSGTITVATLAADFAENYLIDLYFTVTSGAGKITFTAKNYGDDYTITFGGTWLGVGYTQFSNQAGSLATQRPNFQLWADLYYEATYLGGTFTGPIAKLSATADAAFKFYFDPSALLDGYATDQQPILDDVAIRNASEKLLVRYRLKYCEAYGSPITPQLVTTGVIYTALRGRMQYENVGTPGNTFPYYAANPTAQMLTERPVTKNVTKTQNEFLYFLSGDGTSIAIVVTAYFTDGTSATATPPVASSGTGWTVHVIPAGYNQLGVGSVNPAKTVRYYTVALTSGAGIQAGFLYTFTLVETCPPHLRYFVFRNEQGGYDTIPVHGSMMKTNEAERSSGLKILPANYDLLDREHIDYDTRSQDTYEVHTGYHFTKAEVEYYLRQLLMSENVLLHDAGAFTPVNLLTKEADYHRDKFNVYGFRVKFRKGTRHIDRHTTYQK